MISLNFNFKKTNCTSCCTSCTSTNFMDLPNDILIMIYTYTNKEDINNSIRVSKDWKNKYKIIQNEWQKNMYSTYQINCNTSKYILYGELKEHQMLIILHVFLWLIHLSSHITLLTMYYTTCVHYQQMLYLKDIILVLHRLMLFKTGFNVINI